MTKRRIIKMLALVFALAMLLSVTAYAVSWTENGVSCSGWCSRKSAHTEAGSPMYIEAKVYCEYMNSAGETKYVHAEADNAGVFKSLPLRLRKMLLPFLRLRAPIRLAAAAIIILPTLGKINT